MIRLSLQAALLLKFGANFSSSGFICFVKKPKKQHNKLSLR